MKDAILKGTIIGISLVAIICAISLVTSGAKIEPIYSLKMEGTTISMIMPGYSDPVEPQNGRYTLTYTDNQQERESTAVS